MNALNVRNSKQQQGVVLLALVFIISLIFTAGLLKHLNASSSKASILSRGNTDLAYAKAAVIAWAVSNNENLGQLPYPDRNTGGGYDGLSDCPMAKYTFINPDSYKLLIGKLPTRGQSLPCIKNWNGVGIGEHEYAHKRLWYAVSRNIVHDYQHFQGDEASNPVINPSIINTPTYPWLKVFDEKGNLLSDKVAAVIIHPGDAINNQTQSFTATIENYLDTITIAGTQYSNADYDSPDEDFISINRMAANNEQLPMNDQLIYITIDELINALEKRVGLEAGDQLQAYAAKHGGFPPAASLSSEDANGEVGLLKGKLPFDLTSQCQCQSGTSCRCDFDTLEKVSFKTTNTKWTSSTNSCYRNNNTCFCKGSGSCSSEHNSFVCDTNGQCAFSQNQNATPESGEFHYYFADHQYLYDRATRLTGGCKSSWDISKVPNDPKIKPFNNEVICNGSGGFVVGNWLWQNHWQDYLYYAYDASTGLTVNGQNDVEALVISVGQPTTINLSNGTAYMQTRPSNNPLDFLDTEENYNGDDIFEHTLFNNLTNKNDKLFIVSPAPHDNTH